MPLPAGCPCPIESYCDDASNTCVVGCFTDGGCSAGRICDGGACRAGCRQDSQCLAGQICAEDTEVCRAGCRSDSQCRAGQICAEDTEVCRAGCRSDSDCGSGSVCDADADVCRPGCRTNDACDIGEICGPDRVCVAGCDGDDRCAEGSICDGGACRVGCRTRTDCSSEPARDGTSIVCGVDNVCTTFAETGRCFADFDCSLGEACDPEILTCIPVAGGSTCSSTCNFPGTCPTGSACAIPGDASEGRCHIRTTGDVCSRATRCGVNRTCDLYDLRCVPVSCANGNQCDDDMHCSTGSTCQAPSSDSGRFCFEGNFCSDDGDCDQGAICRLSPGLPSSTCTTFHSCSAHEDCAPLHVCSDGGCVPYLNARCESDADCAATAGDIVCDVAIGICIRP